MMKRSISPLPLRSATARPVARELEHDGAAAHLAFDHLAGAAAHQEARSELAERRAVGGRISLIAFGVRDIDVRDPIALAYSGHRRHRRRRRLRAVVALDDHKIALRMR